jgi:hypothetical protein
VKLISSASVFLVSSASCDWTDVAKETCQAIGRTFDDENRIIKSQCTVKCVKEGERVRFEMLPDGTECGSVSLLRLIYWKTVINELIKIIFRRRSTCKYGACL